MFSSEHPDSQTIPNSEASGVIKLGAQWKAEPANASFVAVREIAASQGSYASIPEHLDARLRGALEKLSIHRLYSHQAQALQHAHAGRDFVVATPTASGKTFCYNLPVLDALIRDASATALYLFPTKALARDQVAAAESLAAATDTDLSISVYDGDTPPGARKTARQQSRLIATNPDMLHAALLPHHTRFARFFAGLRWVVVDELHAYRGLFGSHVANVFRRLLRIAQFHGATPRFAGASATIANPGEHAARLFGRPVSVVDENGAPSSPRTFYVYNPPVVDRASGVRGSAVEAAAGLIRDIDSAGAASIAFVRTRTQVEVLVRVLTDGGMRNVRGYRSGYLPGRRREVERELRAGRARTVVATSALELGIDIGSLDAAVIVGWPGSRAALWQRAGRAGRRGAPTVAILVARGEPLDQFVAADTRWLFDESVESARTAPDAPVVVLGHLQCAAFELPFGADETFGPLAADTLDQTMSLLAQEGRVTRAAEGWQWIGQVYPASEVPLRGAAEENFLVIEETRGAVIAEVDRRDAPRLLHEGAIHGIEGQLHEVRRLDWPGHKAYVRRADVDFYTTAISYVKVRPLKVDEQAGAASWGDVHVGERVIGFKKIRLGTHENVGYGEVELPDLETHTQANWWTIADHGQGHGHGLSGPDVGDAAEGAAYALRHAAALFLMSDASDLGVAIESEPGQAIFRIFLYDALPGGGLSEGVFARRQEIVARAFEAIESCPCRSGCPACAGAGRRKTLAKAVITCLVES